MYQVVNQKNAQAEQNDEYIYQKGDQGSGNSPVSMTLGSGD